MGIMMFTFLHELPVNWAVQTFGFFVPYVLFFSMSFTSLNDLTTLKNWEIPPWKKFKFLASFKQPEDSASLAHIPTQQQLGKAKGSFGFGWGTPVFAISPLPSVLRNKTTSLKQETTRNPSSIKVTLWFKGQWSQVCELWRTRKFCHSYHSPSLPCSPIWAPQSQEGDIQVTQA